mmetsp:Transcript_21182/g.45949  ORF Transcript_21182/g.45949 Transcript_21182/m.45949 type:complete len:114 (-) Transcript_21182:97-438(-)
MLPSFVVSFARCVSCRPCSRHSTHPGRRTTKQILPLDPVCWGRTSEKGPGEEAGLTPPSLMSRAVSMALESSDWAASIFEERAMRDGIDIFAVQYLPLFNSLSETKCSASGYV